MAARVGGPEPGPGGGGGWEGGEGRAEGLSLCGHDTAGTTREPHGKVATHADDLVFVCGPRGNLTAQCVAAVVRDRRSTREWPVLGDGV